MDWSLCSGVAWARQCSTAASVAKKIEVDSKLAASATDIRGAHHRSASAAKQHAGAAMVEPAQHRQRARARGSYAILIPAAANPYGIQTPHLRSVAWASNGGPAREGSIHVPARSCCTTHGPTQALAAARGAGSAVSSDRSNGCCNQWHHHAGEQKPALARGRCRLFPARLQERTTTLPRQPCLATRDATLQGCQRAA
jgi:hypothetical protein